VWRDSSLNHVFCRTEPNLAQCLGSRFRPKPGPTCQPSPACAQLYSGALKSLLTKTTKNITHHNLKEIPLSKKMGRRERTRSLARYTHQFGHSQKCQMHASEPPIVGAEISLLVPQRRRPHRIVVHRVPTRRASPAAVHRRPHFRQPSVGLIRVERGHPRWICCGCQ
jgi:hypothetical protein